MVTHDDVRQIALSLPATAEDPNRVAFAVDGKRKVLIDGWRCRAPKRLIADLPPRQMD